MTFHSELRQYDAMMARYAPGREERFELMAAIAVAVGGGSPVVLDAACGPGSFGVHLLRRAPGATVLAADVDPTMLAVAGRVATSTGGRMTVVELDLLDPGWPDAVGRHRFDAVVLASATHYLDDHDLAAVYRSVARVLRPGGVLLNGDELDVPPWCSELRAAVAALDPPDPTEDWGAWWSTLGASPTRDGHHARTPEHHLEALRAAGFDRCGVVWQRFDSHLLVATT